MFFQNISKSINSKCLFIVCHLPETVCYIRHTVVNKTDESLVISLEIVFCIVEYFISSISSILTAFNLKIKIMD